MLHELERQGTMPASAGVDGLVTHLRDKEMVIVCNAALLTLDRHLAPDAAAKPASWETISSSQQATRAVGI
jgi:hypothetical protein